MIYNNQQIEDTTFHLLYLTVVYSSTLKIIYTFIVIYDLEVEVFDIVITYLNIDIFKNVIIYMRQLYGLDDGIRCICCLLKALYGLYGSSKWWYNIIVLIFQKYSFEVFVLNIYYFINRNKSIFFCFYIDDIIVVVLTKMLIA